MAAEDPKLICRLRSTVKVDLGPFDNNAVFSMKWVSDGKPHIIERGVSEEYCVVLYDKDCGVLDAGSSKALHALTKLSTLSVNSQAYVGMDQKVHGNCLVVVNVLAPCGLAQLVISTVVSSYGSLWSKYLTISNQFKKDKHIAKILSDSPKIMKRTHSSLDNLNNGGIRKYFSSSKSLSTSVLETSRKRVKLCDTNSVGNVSASGISHESQLAATTSATNGISDKHSSKSAASTSATNGISDKHSSNDISVIVPVENPTNCSKITTENKGETSPSYRTRSNKNKNKTELLLNNIRSQLNTLSDINNESTNGNDLLLSLQSSSQYPVIDKTESQCKSDSTKCNLENDSSNFKSNEFVEKNIVQDRSQSINIDIVVPTSVTEVSMFDSSDDDRNMELPDMDFSCDNESLQCSSASQNASLVDINAVPNSSEKLNITSCNNIPDIISKLNVNKSKQKLMEPDIDTFNLHKEDAISKGVEGLNSTVTQSDKILPATYDVPLGSDNRKSTDVFNIGCINTRNVVSEGEHGIAKTSVLSPQTKSIERNTAFLNGKARPVKQESISPLKVNKSFVGDGLSFTNNVHASSFNQDALLSQCSSLNGSPLPKTSDSDLPDSIKRKLQVIDLESLNMDRRNNRSNKDADGLPSLMDERGSTNICNFLLRRTEASSCQNVPTNTSSCSTDINNDDDDELNFAADFLSRRNRRHNNAFDDDDELPDGEAEESSAIPNVIAVPDNNEPVVVKDAFDEIFDTLSEFPKNIEVQPCRAIQCVMLPHQKVALNWMMLRENTNELPPFWECIHEGGDYFNLGTRRRIYEKPKSVNGGILADDMGLGKTLTTIALILTNHTNGKTLVQKKNILPVNASEICDDLALPKKKRKSIKSNSAEKKDLKKPGFLFRQMYLEKVTKKEKKKKSLEVKQGEQMFPPDTDEDNIVAVDSIINNLPVTPKKVCSPKFSEDDKTRKSTLIVCPMSVLSNWTDQLEQHVHPSVNLQIYLYYGPERIRDVDYLKKHDIILTTYGTLTYDYRAEKQKEKEKVKGKEAPLHRINWLRIVLDEGHVIRNSRSQQTIAAMALNASRRWILTGTVIQNRMTDLWSMIKFLRIEPFSERQWWNKHVVKSLERRSAPGETCFNRIQKIVKHIAIRRLKTDEINGKPLVQLPKREVIIKYVDFSEEERKVYDGMQKDGKFVVSRYFRMNTIFKNYANILVIIMRLRQLCCHPMLCTKAIEKLDQARSIMGNLMEKIDDNNLLDSDLNDEVNAISEEDRQKLVSQIMMFLASGDSEECSICLEILREPVITRCAHIYCSTCINEVIENTDGGATCPLCRAEIDTNTLLSVPVEEKAEIEKPVETNIADDEEWHSSAKVDSLMECLQAEEPGTKSLVVSQFTSFLDIVEKPLKDAGIQFCRLDGTMKQADRVRVMDEFKDTDGLSPTVMLLSLTAGGVGLNLISASRVFLLDPAWNPAVEEQCFDRCHRLGQTRDVKIYKFLVKDTVEDRMLILQEKKRKLMQKAFGGGIKQNAEQRRRAVLRDISTLLDLNLNLNNIPPPS